MTTAGGGALLFVSLWLLSTPGFSSTLGFSYPGAAHCSLVAKPFGDTAPAWSPDGKEVAFSRSGLIKVWNLRSRKLRTIDSGTDPTWSPDGKTLLFTRSVAAPPPQPGTYSSCGYFEDDLFRAPTTGRVAAIAVTNSQFAGETAPTWSANSGIAYQFYEANGRQGIAALDPAGGPPRILVSAQLVLPEPQFATFPSWSPDGRKLAFAGINWREAGRAPPQHRIFTANADGSGVEPIANGQAFDPAWAPNGRRIAFSRMYGSGDVTRDRGSWAVFVVASDGREERFLTKGFEPAWSPDGSRIVLVRERAFPRRGYCWVDNLFVLSLKGKKTHAMPLLPPKLRATSRPCPTPTS